MTVPMTMTVSMPVTMPVTMSMPVIVFMPMVVNMSMAMTVPGFMQRIVTAMNMPMSMTVSVLMAAVTMQILMLMSTSGINLEYILLCIQMFPIMSLLYNLNLILIMFNFNMIASRFSSTVQRFMNLSFFTADLRCTFCDSFFTRERRLRDKVFNVWSSFSDNFMYVCGCFCYNLFYEWSGFSYGFFTVRISF